jgi:hypothetical protein
MHITHRLTSIAAALLMVIVAAPAAAGPTINLIDMGGVTGSKAEQGFKIAAKYWESVLTNDVVLNFNVGFSKLPPNVLGGTSSNLFQFVPITAYYDLLNAGGNSALDAQAATHRAPLDANGSVTVQVPAYLTPATQNGVAASGTRTAPANTAISKTIALSTANGKALFGGNQNVVDGTIQFSSDFGFDFNPTDGITAGTSDFIGVAVHEMGHALGFLSGADDFDYSVGPGAGIDGAWWGYGMDMFRYSAPGVLNWSFNTPSYFSVDGGVTPFRNGALSTGSNYGDGNQASHWKAPTASPFCSNFLGVMNPYICNGRAGIVTGLDLALFDAIGWNTNIDVIANPQYAFTTAQMYAEFAVPEPTSSALLLAGFGAMIGLARRRNRRAAVVA